jgi:AcrR family transcriptional regulator
MARLKRTERDQTLTNTRRMLLDAAAEVLARDGYAVANINHISEAAGFAKGTVYNYFPSKRALMMALIEDISAAHLEAIAGPVRAETDARLRLERFFEAGFEWVERYPAPAQVMIVTLNGPDAEFKQSMYAAYQPMFALVRQNIVAAGVEQGVFRAVDLGETTALLMTLYLGTCSQVDARGKPWLAPGKVAGFAFGALRPQPAGQG